MSRYNMPEGTSDIRGAMIGEIVRELVDYRELWKAEHE